MNQLDSPGHSPTPEQDPRSPERGGGKDNRLTTLAYVLIGAGALLLIGRLGWFDWSGLLGLLRFWPVLVIAVGIDMLTGGRRRALVYGAGILVVLLLAFTGGGTLNRTADTVQVTQELGGATSAEVHIATSLADLRLTSDARSELLASGSLGQHAGERVNVDHQMRGDRARFSASSRGVGPRFMAFRRAVPWDLTLTGRVPIALTVETGVGESTLDLGQLQLESLSIDAGVGQITVDLPNTGAYRASIDGGVGEIVVRVPRGLAVRIAVDTGIGTVQVADHFTRSGNVYTSPTYDATGRGVELDVDAGIGTIRLVATD